MTVPRDTTLSFSLTPLRREGDTLSYRWTLNGDSVGADSAVTVPFPNLGEQAVVGRVIVDADADSVVWRIMVVPPEGVSDFGLRILDFGLSEPFPNPFNATAAVNYHLSAFSRVNLSLYDINGRLVGTLVDGWESAGEHRATIGGQAGTPAPLGLAAGVYFLRLQVLGSTGAPPGGRTFSPLIRKLVVVG